MPAGKEKVYGFKKRTEGILDGRGWRGSDRGSAHSRGNIYPLIHAIYYVDTVEIVEIEKQYKQECV